MLQLILPFLTGASQPDDAAATDGRRVSKRRKGETPEPVTLPRRTRTPASVTSTPRYVQCCSKTVLIEICSNS